MNNSKIGQFIAELRKSRQLTQKELADNLNIISAIFSIILLIGIIVTVIVNVAMTGALTWSLIPIFSCTFVWVVLIPMLKYGTRGIIVSLAACTVLTVPFLLALDFAIDRLLAYDTVLFNIGVRTAPFAVAYIWAAYFLFKKFNTRLLLPTAILVLLVSPVSYSINVIVVNMTDAVQSILAVVLNTGIPVIVAAILFIVEYVLRKRAIAT